MPATSFNHINIKAPAGLLKICRDFYVDVLGLRDGYRPETGDRGYWLYGDANEALIHMTITETRQAGTSYYDHIAFNCSDLSGMQQRLLSLGVEFDEQPTPDGKRLQLFLTDPCDLGVELNFKL